MIEEGDAAPSFELPAFREGEFESVDLDDVLGDSVVILAFYPADFNPACTDESADLDDLDLFTMQKDVKIFGISGDSVYSHKAFADEYNLHIPLLADVDGEVADAYGLALDEASDGYHNRRAIIVIDHGGTVDYAWVGDKIDDLPDVDKVRLRVQDMGSEETAEARYTVGHAHYIEGRRAFTSAMKAFEDREWMMAQGDFDRAADEFDEAKEEFNTAVRFSEDQEGTKYFERAENKAESLWRASEWLRDSANAFASGEGAKGDAMRDDAEAPLEEAKAIHEPPDPDDFPPEQDPAELTDEEASEVDTKAYLEEDDEEVDTSLDLEDDEDLAAGSAADAGPEDMGTAEPQSTESSGADAANDPTDASTETGQAGNDAVEAGDAGTEPAQAAEGDTSEPEGADIDDTELEEIAAEIEEQSEAAEEPETDPTEEPDSGLVPDEIEPTNGPGETDDGAAGNDNGEDDLEEEDLDLDLTDPTDGEGLEAMDEDGEQDEDDEEESDADAADDTGDTEVSDSL